MFKTQALHYSGHRFHPFVLVHISTTHNVNFGTHAVDKPREHALDAHLFSRLTEAGKRAAERLVNNQHVGVAAQSRWLRARALVLVPWLFE